MGFKSDVVDLVFEVLGSALSSIKYHIGYNIDTLGEALVCCKDKDMLSAFPKKLIGLLGDNVSNVYTNHHMRSAGLNYADHGTIGAIAICMLNTPNYKLTTCTSYNNIIFQHLKIGSSADLIYMTEYAIRLIESMIEKELILDVMKVPMMRKLLKMVRNIGYEPEFTPIIDVLINTILTNTHDEVSVYVTINTVEGLWLASTYPAFFKPEIFALSNANQIAAINGLFNGDIPLSKVITESKSILKRKQVAITNSIMAFMKSEYYLGFDDTTKNICDILMVFLMISNGLRNRGELVPLSLLEIFKTVIARDMLAEI